MNTKLKIGVIIIAGALSIIGGMYSMNYLGQMHEENKQKKLNNDKAYIEQIVKYPISAKNDISKAHYFAERSHDLRLTAIDSAVSRYKRGMSIDSILVEYEHDLRYFLN